MYVTCDTVMNATLMHQATARYQHLMNVPEILESEKLPFPITHRDSYVPYSCTWPMMCVCTWLVIHMYVSDDTVMNALLSFVWWINVPKIVEDRDLLLPTTFTDSHILLYSCTWPMMCVYVTCDTHVHDRWCSDECHTNAHANALGCLYRGIML